MGGLHIHNSNHLFHHTPKGLYWISIGLEYTQLIFVFEKSFWDDLSFLIS